MHNKYLKNIMHHIYKCLRIC